MLLCSWFVNNILLLRNSPHIFSLKRLEAALSPGQAVECYSGLSQTLTELEHVLKSGNVLKDKLSLWKLSFTALVAKKWMSFSKLVDRSWIIGLRRRVRMERGGSTSGLHFYRIWQRLEEIETETEGGSGLKIGNFGTLSVPLFNEILYCLG